MAFFLGISRTARYPAGMCLRSMVALAVVLFTARARADAGSAVDLRGFTPPVSDESSIYAEPTRVPDAGAWNVSAWLGYAHRGVVLEDEHGDDAFVPVRHQVSLDYAGAIGLGRSLAIALSIPTVLYQTGDAVPTADPLPQTAIGDATLSLKTNLMHPGSLGGLGVGALGRVSLPTGDGAPYLTESQPNAELRILGELRLLVADLGASLGAKLRSREREFAGTRFGHSVPFGLGLTVRPQALGWDRSGAWLVSLEAFGALSVTPELAEATQSPVNFALSQRYTLGEVSGLLGVVLPARQAAGTPAARGILAIGWAPRFYDEDRDGVEDERDECPELEEDHDGFEDDDGCPEFDNDADGVGDLEDQCPRSVEDRDGFEDDDGCSDLDNDGDGVPDASDGCPTTAQGPTPDPSRSGCPALDRDSDDLLDSEDRCPDQNEDKDGHDDGDGCPDPDNDGDGIVDLDDRCPDAAGVRSDRADYYGCPDPDPDGDTFFDAADRCPTLAEDFDGDDDEDGCPDAARSPNERARSLVALEVDAKSGVASARLSGRISFEANETAALTVESLRLVRALAALLNQHRDRKALVRVAPLGSAAPDMELAFGRAGRIVDALRDWTSRADAAEVAPWTELQGPAARARSRRVAGAQSPDVRIELESFDRPQAAEPAQEPAAAPTKRRANPTGPEVP